LFIKIGGGGDALGNAAGDQARGNPGQSDLLNALPGAFYATETTRLSRMACAMGLPRSEAEEAIQDVWLDLVKHRAGFPEPGEVGRLRSWLTRVVRSKAVDALRRLSRQRAEGLEALREKAAGATAYAEAAELKECREWLYAKVDELGADREDAELLRRHYLEEQSYAAIAEETGRTVAAVRCRIGRALQDLKRLAAAHPPGGGPPP
jgi:RNA polymerase sigma factor (sigma-70 family)